MKSIPRDKTPDSTFVLLLKGYRFITSRCDRYNTDIFQTRLMLRNFLCMRGEEAASIFYDDELFQRAGVMPRRIQESLIGRGGVQLLDGQAHKSRKAMLMSLMKPESVRRLADLVQLEWNVSLNRWERRSQVILFPEAQQLLCRAGCRWAGVPLEEDEVRDRTRDFAAMIDSPAAVGPRHWRGRRARKRTEQWIGELVEKVRSGKMASPSGSALGVIAGFTDIDGRLLDRRTAAVELINLLRPTVAIARYVVFAATALHENGAWRAVIGSRDEQAVELFTQEVRRFYPFFPFVGARVKKTFEWKGYRFPKGRKVLLDLYGTNHDPRLWENPEAFLPERFRDWNGSPYNFIPQGGGDHFKNHRCAGEWITQELLKVSVRFICQSMNYTVPGQDLRIRLSRIPALPKSRFIMENINRIGVRKVRGESAAA